ncbi:MAG: S8 family serine peptidase, partial [Cytophaga sp.]
MKKIYISITFFSYSLILLLFSLSTVYAQNNSPKADFEADILLVKVKTEYRDFFNDTAAVHLLQNFISPVKIISAKKTFPNCTPPAEADHVDLTRIYTVSFSGIEKKNLANLSRLIQGYGYFDYVQLKYIQTQHAVFYPNDPGIAAGYQNYLGRMKAYEAWAIEKGDPNLVIGIIDTGVDYTHEDLVANIAFNLADPINGIDDDNDGYIDNY